MKLLEECLGELYELQGHIAWKKGSITRYHEEYLELEDLIARVAARVTKPLLVRFTNKGKCDLGLALEAYRIKRGWRVKDMMDAIGCSDNAYRRWIRGTQPPSRKTRVKLARLIGEAWL